MVVAAVATDRTCIASAKPHEVAALWQRYSMPHTTYHYRVG